MTDATAPANDEAAAAEPVARESTDDSAADEAQPAATDTASTPRSRNRWLAPVMM